MNGPISRSAKILKDAIASFNPTYIVSLVSGGKDSAASDQVAREVGAKIDLVIHGNTRCGIPQTSDFVREHYGHLADSDFAEADAGTAYVDYVFRKGFFGVGISSHAVAYHLLKADPFRKAMSKHLRKGKRGVRIMLLTGARQDESDNRQKNLKPISIEPSRPNNAWVPITIDWTQDERDEYLASRGTPINPVATQLCRSGECMCGTMQSKGDRAEASLLYPEWGKWIDSLEAEIRPIHGYGWGEKFPRKRDVGQGELFQPMCVGCVRQAVIPAISSQTTTGEPV